MFLLGANISTNNFKNFYINTFIFFHFFFLSMIKQQLNDVLFVDHSFFDKLHGDKLLFNAKVKKNCCNVF